VVMLRQSLQTARERRTDLGGRRRKISVNTSSFIRVKKGVIAAVRWSSVQNFLSLTHARRLEAPRAHVLVYLATRAREPLHVVLVELDS
jgi:hypothetical protein